MSIMARDLVPLSYRLANALIAFTAYLGKMLWPSSLAVFYPHPGTGVSWPLAAASLVVLAIASLLFFRQRRQRPYLLVGWFWYLGMLVPVIGIAQIGIQAYADRYTYLPLIGPFLMIAWLAGDVLPILPGYGRRALTLAAGAIVSVLAVTAAIQAGHWRDSVALFRHAVIVVPDNWFAYRSLGLALSDEGRPEEAMAVYREALRLRPRDARSHNDLGVELARQGRHQEAIEHYREAIHLWPGFAEVHNNLGNALAMTGQRNEAIEEYNKAIVLRPGWQVPRDNLRMLIERLPRSGQTRTVQSSDISAREQ
jgi:tetratricopeptide (TPR) repeat protein